MDNILLDLTTKRDRSKILIDGKMYEIYTREDYSITVITEMQKAAEAAKAIADKPETTKEDLKQIAEMIDDSVKRIVRGIRKRVLKKLSFSQKMEIIQVFSKAAVGVEKSRRRGVRSPGSKDSTEATP